MAVIKIKGKQYLVKEGQEIVVANLNMEPGEKVKAKDLLTDKDVTLEVIGQKRGEKVRIIKFRHKTRYKRFLGFRSTNTVIKMDKAEEKVVSKKAEKPAKKRATKAKAKE